MLVPSMPTQMTARTAAQCLSGVIALVCRRFSVDDMQRACADLVRWSRGWETSLGELPRDYRGRVPEQIELIAVVARGLYSLAGVENLQAALSFWATETDPVVWMSLNSA
jgi:hypothetical protein